MCFAGTLNQQQAAPAAALLPLAHWPSKEQIAAAAKYYKDAVKGAKQRPPVPYSKYIIPPEPLEMRTQHKKVRSSDSMTQPAHEKALKSTAGHESFACQPAFNLDKAVG
jgi:hypothetical protein